MDIKQTALTNQTIKQILSFLPYFSEDHEFGKWSGGKKINGTMTMPHLIYSDKVSEFLHILYDTKFIVIFDWAQWDEGREIITNPDLIQKSDLLTLRMLLTAIIRNDRFCEGEFLNAIKNRTIKNILERLKIITNT